MADKPKVTVELEPGQYLVDVFCGRARVWKHEGNGRVSGFGGKFTKPSVGVAFYEMTVLGQHAEEEAVERERLTQSVPTKIEGPL